MGEASNIDRSDIESPRRSRVVSGWKRPIFLLSASLFLVLGFLGALLPVLPATPFLLLTSYFLVRSSPRLNAALLRSKLFGPMLTDWQVKGGVQKPVKVKAIFAVVVAVVITIFASGHSVVPSLIVSLLAFVGIIVILRLPSVEEKTAP